MKSDAASQHRAAGTLALAFGAAVIISGAGTFTLDVRRGIAFNARLAEVPDASWTMQWLPGAVSPAAQQQAAVEQWLHVILVFGAIAFGIAFVNALIGFVSYANERRYETAVRGLVGASRRQLTAALLRRAAVNAALGAAIGVAVGSTAARMLRAQWQQPGHADYADWILVACAASLALAAFSARSAARRLQRPGWMGDALAPEARTVPGFGAEDLRALLTVAQLACAVALTTVSLLVWSYASSRPASHHERAGRYIAHVALAEDTTPAERQALYAHIASVLDASGQIEAESIASAGAMLGIGTIDKVISDCGPCSRANLYTPFFALETQQHVAGRSLFATAGIRLLAGREFKGDASDAGRIVVNELFAREAFMEQNPIGKRVLVGGFAGGRWYSVIGVVENVRPVALQTLEPDPALGEAAHGGILPAIYFSAVEHTPARFDVVVRANTQPVVAHAGLSFEPLGRVIDRAAAPQQSFSRVLTVLGLLLCGAALVGTFMTTMLSVRAREAEITVRRAVGARRRDVWKLIYLRVAAITMRGVLAGIVISIAIARGLEVFVPGLPLLDVRLLLLVAAGFFVIAFAAALLPLRAALRIAPAAHHE